MRVAKWGNSLAVRLLVRKDLHILPFHGPDVVFALDKDEEVVCFGATTTGRDLYCGGTYANGRITTV